MSLTRRIGDQHSEAQVRAVEYFKIAAGAIEAGLIDEAIREGQKAIDLLLRDSAPVEDPANVIGEHVNFGLLGKVLAEKARRAQSK